jgi:hypothetical protein
MNKFLLIFTLTILISLNIVKGQSNNTVIPNVLSNIKQDENGEFFFVSPKSGAIAKSKSSERFFTQDKILVNPVGTEEGILFDFKNKQFSGTIYYGMFSSTPSKFPEPVFFKTVSKIKEGKASINLKAMGGVYDIADYEETGKIRLGYRITDSFGKIIYDGKLNITGKGPFEVSLSITEGPFVNKITENSAVISFNTNFPSSPVIIVNGKEYRAVSKMANLMGDTHHEILVDKLDSDTEYEYSVKYDNWTDTYSFKTNPKKGSKKPFIFAYASDSRSGKGGGERDIHGTNAYIMKKMAALAMSQNAAFFQFTGDMISGYSPSISETKLEYKNWKRNVEPFWHYMPFYVTTGNHEVVVNTFDDGSKWGLSIDKFPYNTSSGERTFADEYVNFENGPSSEDGSKYDPDENKTDFPPYKENVYYYIYDNVAMIVLNSNYLYTTNASKIPDIGGNVHGYIMDNQLEWLQKTLEKLNNDSDIDHIFVTIHTPAFPNGGHAGDDMWYNGNNNVRPYIAGEPVKKGIIERRDEFLNLLINESDKVVALLTGDEHNYSRLKLTKETVIYPKKWNHKKLKISRPFWQITNGSAGAPYYGQQTLPWTPSVEFFSTQYALMLFNINGKKVSLKVINPDTMELIENVVLKE